MSVPALEAFERKLDNPLSDIGFDLYSCIEQGFGLDGIIGSFQFNDSVILLLFLFVCYKEIQRKASAHLLSGR